MQMLTMNGCPQRGPRRLEITLTEGRNRQIRKMCESLGYVVRSLHRTHVAGITLSGLRSGHWKDLDHIEMRTVEDAMRRAREL